MARKILVNLAVKDLDRSVTFFTTLGFGFDQRFTTTTPRPWWSMTPPS